jgi:hypothetical protein
MAMAQLHEALAVLVLKSLLRALPLLRHHGKLDHLRDAALVLGTVEAFVHTDAFDRREVLGDALGQGYSDLIVGVFLMTR